MNIKIKVTNLCKTFGDKKVLKGIDVKVMEGQSLAIIGGSGSGKSVFLKCLIGIMLPDENSEVIIDGQNVTSVSIDKRYDFVNFFGMLFQGGALFDSLTVAENICFGLLQSNQLAAKDIYDYAVSKLKLVGLKPETAKLLPVELSGGMQKRVALARAIAANPKVIFFDEPTSGLDPIMTGVISDLIHDISKQIKATTLIISHDMECVRRTADSVVMLHDGHFIWQGKGTEFKKTKNHYIKQFISGSAQGPIKI